jgi:hypothetical protein
MTLIPFYICWLYHYAAASRYIVVEILQEVQGCEFCSSTTNFQRKSRVKIRDVLAATFVRNPRLLSRDFMRRDISRHKNSGHNAQTRRFIRYSSKQNIVCNRLPKVGIRLSALVYYVDRKCRGFLRKTLHFYDRSVTEKLESFYKPRYFIHFRHKISRI